ncbi:MAG: zf-HC2 domain-containing protein [Acidimicrobiia bacterium]|nr:zf-HC2 domain-containing protein [Acidimicrobiia bacterium]NNC43215.1 hypothetical protein [Acidimicrobiia bacterium]NNL48784.1 hypothetical protein [Acidimicrobiia bacterium]
MNCSKVAARVYQYLDNEGMAWQRRRIERHINGCVDCTEVVQFERQVLNLVQEACREEEVPPELFGRLQTLIDKERNGELD